VARVLRRAVVPEPAARALGIRRALARTLPHARGRAHLRRARRRRVLLLDADLLGARAGSRRGAGARRALEEGAAAYRGELLEGLAVRDAEEFESWLIARRETARTQVCDVLKRLVDSTAQRHLEAR